jgi:hypothetical protein
MNRQEFKYHACRTYGNMVESIMNETEPFWIPEYREGYKASCFMVTKRIPNKRILRTTVNKKIDIPGAFWDWCRDNMSKLPMCFMSDSFNDVEWWGFNTEDDAALFLLKWT